MNSNTPKLLMTKSEYAAHRRVGKSAVSNWASKGLIVMAEEQGTGKLKVDVARTDAKVNANIDPTRGRPATAQAEQSAVTPTIPAAVTNGENGELQSARLESLQEGTVARRLANARQAGMLVALAEYEARAGAAMTMVRERVHSVIRDNAEKLASERDPRQVVAILGDEVDQAFADLADQIERGTQSDAVDDAAAEAALEAINDDVGEEIADA